MLSRHRLTGQLLNSFFSPVLHGISSYSYENAAQDETVGFEAKTRRSRYVSEGGRTHISPSATMQIVCQTPRPIRGATPR